MAPPTCLTFAGIADRCQGANRTSSLRFHFVKMDLGAVGRYGMDLRASSFSGESSMASGRRVGRNTDVSYCLNLRGGSEESIARRQVVGRQDQVHFRESMESTSIPPPSQASKHTRRRTPQSPYEGPLAPGRIWLVV